MSKEKIENIISKINNELVNCSKIVQSGKIPEFDVLNDFVREFTENLSKLDVRNMAEYSGLLQIWSGELKTVIDNLAVKKSDIQEKLENALLNNKVMNNYNKLN